MSATFQILAPLTPREMLDLEAACEREVAREADALDGALGSEED